LADYFCIEVFMPRPTLLVAEREPLQALSTRKLVLETGKFNVITAHSTQEALDLFHLFPNISVAVLATDPDNTIDCARIADAIKKATHRIPVIALSPVAADICNFADHTISSHEPETLLHLIRSLVGDPRTIDGK
jgi:CheY-like chemotaxis protein